MKHFFLFLICLFATARLCAQVTDPKDAAKDDATNKVNSNISNGVDNTVNKTEGAIKGLFKKKKKADAAPTQAPPPPPAAPDQSAPSAVPASGASDAGSVKVYQNYDFIAGDKIIFADDFTADQNGEFPAHWELMKGQAVMNLQAGKKAMAMTDGNYAVVFPRMSNKKYLGNEFTIEYDTYFESNAYSTHVFFLLPETETDADGYVNISSASADFENSSENNHVSLSGNLPAAIAEGNYENKWHHIAIGYKNKQLKVYVDQYRVLTVPDCKMAPGSIQFGGLASQEAPLIFTNVKIAQGGSQNMIGNILTNGKFVTHGITFDIDRATIKPESMGVINEVATFLKSNASIKMEIDGHTDNTGNSPHNMQLSQQRADAVKMQLASMGVDASRLSTKGLGDTKPVADNTSPEGKANNRRVEFVKM